MNNEKYNQIIDEAYKRYVNHWGNPIDPVNFELYTRLDLHPDKRLFTQEEFVNKCKTNPEFSETWGLKFEERELSLEERVRLTINTPEYRNYSEQQWKEYIETTSVPKRAITITCNNTKTEVYE